MPRCRPIILYDRRRFQQINGMAPRGFRFWAFEVDGVFVESKVRMKYGEAKRWIEGHARRKFKKALAVTVEVLP